MSMTEVLIPYSEFSASELGGRLHEIVTENRKLLAARHLLGLLDRYGADIDTAVAKVSKGQSEDNPRHFAVVDEAGDVQGSASIFEGLPLGKLRLPMPAGLARRSPGLYTTYPYASHNIHAWTREGQSDVLANAYSALANNFKYDIRTVSFSLWRRGMWPWTIEPVRAPRYIHEVILDAGLAKVASRRFDDGESGHAIPPRSTLYAHIEEDWMTAHGKQRELRTGKKPYPATFADYVGDSSI